MSGSLMPTDRPDGAPEIRDQGADSAALYSVIADGYDGSYDRPSHRRLYDRLAWEHVSALALPPFAHIVDVGCGTGRWIPRWLARGHRVTGIERAPGMIEVLRSRHLGAGFRLIEACMEQADLEPASADMVLALGSMQYASDPAAMIRRFAGWVRPGGFVCVYVDSLVSLVVEMMRDGRHGEAQERLRTRRGEFRQDGRTASLALYDRRTLETHFAAAGLIEVRCFGLAVSAGVDGRQACSAAMQQDEDRAMALDRTLSNEPAFADLGLHILAVGTVPG